MPVIGWLNPFSPPTNLGELARGPIHRGLSDSGFVEGQNMVRNTASPKAIMIGCPLWPPT
jgi:hypothetical protein